MKRSHLLLLLLLNFPAAVSPSLAAPLPSLEEARALLGSRNAQERDAATLEIWKGGKNALTLLEKLSQDQDPEISTRASHILRRFRMGLMPDSPPELLTFAEQLEHASPETRHQHLSRTLEHPQGMSIALPFFDLWSSRENEQGQPLQSLAKLIIENLLEQRRDWQTAFSSQLSPPCRASLIAELSRQNFPMKRQLIALLGNSAIGQIYPQLKKLTPKIDPETLETLARLAIVEKQIPLAMQILSENLPHAKTREPARAMAFLEASAKFPCPPYEGPWQQELQLYQARLNKEPQRILALSASLQDQSYFKYENHLMSGTLTLPSHNGRSEPLPNAPALRALHTAFGERAHEADIEALSAETLLDWTDLARTLTLLSRPLEAAETLFLNGQNASAVNLLWRCGKRAEALRLAEESCANFDERTQLKTRLILASLQLEAGQEKEAKKTFQPLLGRDSLRELDRKKVISLGMQLFPRDELLPLAPGLKSELAYQRAPAIASFLPFPAPVSVFWYEHFLAEDDSLTPLSLFQKIETFLNGDRTRAREILTQQIELRKFPKNNLLLPNDPLYQNILFLKLPESLEIVQKAAWYQLSVRDLLRIIQDDSWPAETRQAALESGLLIDPINPSLHWHSRQNGGPVDEKTIHHLTLGEARLTLNLAALTEKRESLRLAAELADLRDAAAIRCLSILAKSLLAQQKADEAARLYQVLLCGEIAVGTQPATRIPATLENLSNYLKARQQSAPDQTHQKIWQERLRAIGKGQAAQNPSQNSAE